MKILGMITARGGSKGIPGKNIKLLAGRPLIAYTIEAAKASDVFDRLILSTDDEKIAAIGRAEACEVPFMRPAELAQDDTPHAEVLRHAVQWLKEHERYSADAVMILQPTAPLRTATHIKEAVELMQKTHADAVVSVSRAPGHFNPHWQFVMDEKGSMDIFTGEPFSNIIPRRQDLPATYTRNGAIYLFKTDLLMDSADPGFYGDHPMGYIMDEKHSVNIDTMEDWAKAERVMKENSQ